MSPSPTPRSVRPTAVLARRRDYARRWFGEEDRGLFALLSGLTVAAGALMYFVPDVSAAALMVPLLLTDMVLTPRRIPVFVTFLLAVLVIETLLELDRGLPTYRWVSALLVVVTAGAVLLVGWRRTRLGVGGLAGEAMLLDLQDRINRQGELPPLPDGWYVDAATRSAGGTSFAGDFMVAHRQRDRSSLSLAVVDVSGKGVDAGTRALLLSGALGALLGAVPPDRFLPAANDFLLRQEWGEGFATAVQLELDLRTGAYEVRSAGHPPAIRFRAGSGTWLLHDSHGPALGLLPEAEFPANHGELQPGDALLLYTDGLVERPRRDISLGIDRLIGESERLVGTGFRDAAGRLVATLGAPSDDCALLVLQRS